MNGIRRSSFIALTARSGLFRMRACRAARTMWERMVILLDGTSQVARVTIAEKAVESHPEWKHLALEVFDETIPEGEDKDFHLQVIKRCADELAKANMHLFLTLPADSPHRWLLSQALKPDCISVHLGSDEGGEYDYAIDPTIRSVNDVTAFLNELMTPSDEAL